jgi:hypothetical protein
MRRNWYIGYNTSRSAYPPGICGRVMVSTFCAVVRPGELTAREELAVKSTAMSKVQMP